MFPQNLRRRFRILHILYLGWKMRQKRKRNVDLSSEYTGATYTMELLTGNDRQCEELMRMPRETYIKLCQHFKEKNWLRDSRYISVEEKIAMFLNIVSHGKCVRLIKRRFQHSTQTVHHYFHEVLGAMIEFSKEMIVPTTYDLDPNVPGYHKRLRSVFKGAVGALDGTLVHAIVPTEKQTPYRGRGRDICFQNVLAICDFNMIFTFVFAGWEGVAHDSRILHEVAFDPIHCFPFPPPVTLQEASGGKRILVNDFVIKRYNMDGHDNFKEYIE